MDLKCPFCGGDMVSTGEAELLRKTDILERALERVNWRPFLPVQVWVCRNCRFLSLFASKEPRGESEKEWGKSLWEV